MMLRNYKVGICVVVIYLSTFIITYLNPMQSDDFAFYFKGLSFQEHWLFYTTWSGRVIADYISTLILSINNHFIIALISSLGLPLLIYNIATLAYYREQERHSSRLAFSIIILWGGYWLGNSALGQTTFWVVGEANYLWPLVFVSALFKYLLSFLYNKNITKPQIIFLLCLSVLSGCSNEATGALVLYSLALLYGWALFNQLANRYLIVTCLVVVFISYLILLLAPGNFVRAAIPEFTYWREMGLEYRLTNHFLYVVPSILKGYGVIYLLLLWAAVQAYHFIKRGDWQLVVICLSAVLVFCCILMASPHASLPRTHITGLLFLLIALSLLLKEAFNKEVSGLGKSLFGVFFCVCAFSYGCILLGYLSLSNQNTLRLSIISQEKKQGEQEVLIPNYFRPFVLSEGDLPDLDYHNPGMMGKYYGVNKVNLVFVDFDYVKLLNTPCPIKYPAISQPSSVVQCIYVQRSFLSNNLKFVVKFSPDIVKIKNYETRFRLQVKNTFDSSDPHYYEITLPLRIVKIGSQYFASVDTLSSLLALTFKSELIVKIYGPVNLSDGSDSSPIFIKVK